MIGIPSQLIHGRRDAHHHIHQFHGWGQIGTAEISTNMKQRYRIGSDSLFEVESQQDSTVLAGVGYGDRGGT